MQGNKSEGTAKQCVATSMLTEFQDKANHASLTPEQERLLRNVAGVAYIGVY